MHDLERNEAPQSRVDLALRGLLHPVRHFPRAVAALKNSLVSPTTDIQKMTEAMGYAALSILNHGHTQIVIAKDKNGFLHALKIVAGVDRNAEMRHARELVFLDEIARDNPYFVQLIRIVEWEHAEGADTHRPRNDLVIDMEYVVPGISCELFTHEAAERYSWNTLDRSQFTAQVGAQVCRGLLGTLKKGQMYRPFVDIKASNVLLYAPTPTEPNQFIKIIDANAIARRMHDIQSPDELPLLTPTVTAPEIVTSMSKGTRIHVPFSMKSDVYALGCTLLKLLTGKYPFRGNTANAIYLQQIYDMPDMKLLPHDTPRELKAILAAMLEKDTKNRPYLAEVQRHLEYVAGIEPFPWPRPRTESETELTDPMGDLFEQDENASVNGISHDEPLSITARTRAKVGQAKQKGIDL